MKKLAIVADKICGDLGGAESITFNTLDIFPNTPVYITVCDKKILPDQYKSTNIIPSFVQNLPLAKKIYKAYLPLMPLAMEGLNMQDYDVIFSSHHSAAKSIIPRPDAFHVCYCHSPARYLWDLYWTYAKLNGFNSITNSLVQVISQYLRMLDVTSSSRVDLFLANSKYTAARIRKFYRRNAYVLHPPVETNKFKYQSTDDYYFMVGRLVAYKGFELAIDAFNESGKKLIIAGSGPEYNRLKSKANKNIELLGRVSDEDLIKYMNNCKGYIFPGKEDFGIVMAEAQSAGKPVIAFGEGGAFDIVIDNQTGVLYKEQTVESLNNAIQVSENIKWNHSYIEEHSRQFDKEMFKNKLNYIISNADRYCQLTEQEIIEDINSYSLEALSNKI